MLSSLSALITVVLFALFFDSLFPATAYAYLDPGTGSIILQALAAGFFGSIFAIKLYWSKIVSLFRKEKR